MRITIILLFAACIGSVFSQSAYFLNFIPKVGNTTYTLNTIVDSKSGQKVELDYFNYYISNLHVFYNGGQDLDLSDTVFLVKNDAYALSLGNLNISNVEKISFGIGVPEELNHLDISLYPEGHPLSFQDPSMHWGWTSGYNQMIVGGNADGDNNDAPESYFEIHSLGDKNYHVTEVFVCEEIDANSQFQLNVYCNIDVWLGLTDLAQTGIYHGEDGLNLTIMKAPINSPVFTSDCSYLTSTNFAEQGNISYFKENNDLTIQWTDLPDMDKVELINANGEILYQESNQLPTAEIKLAGLKNGVYFFRSFSDSHKLLKQIKILL